MFADPVCPELRAVFTDAARESGARVHERGTYLCMEGPQFSTRAESRMYRTLGADVIGMTNLQEARLAREAEICYGTIAMVTDYDCWREGHEDVTVEAILAVMARNVDRARGLIRSALQKVEPVRRCTCGDALRYAILTDPARIPREARDRLGLLLDRYLDT
jgi:5'-methylthioadenosine phosphorylase